MGIAWEVTDEDIEDVLVPHNIDFTPLIRSMVNEAEVVNTVLHYCNFDNQVDAALSNIEDQLIKAGVIKAPKMFEEPSDDDDDIDAFEEFEDF